MKMEGDGFLEWFPITDYFKRFDVCDISWRRENVVFTLAEDALEDILDDTKQNRRYELIWSSSDMISYQVSEETYRAD